MYKYTDQHLKNCRYNYKLNYHKLFIYLHIIIHIWNGKSKIRKLVAHNIHFIYLKKKKLYDAKQPITNVKLFPFMKIINVQSQKFEIVYFFFFFNSTLQKKKYIKHQIASNNVTTKNGHRVCVL